MSPNNSLFLCLFSNEGIEDMGDAFGDVVGAISELTEECDAIDWNAVLKGFGVIKWKKLDWEYALGDWSLNGLFLKSLLECCGVAVESEVEEEAAPGMGGPWYTAHAKNKKDLDRIVDIFQQINIRLREWMEARA